MCTCGIRAWILVYSWRRATSSHRIRASACDSWQHAASEKHMCLWDVNIGERVHDYSSLSISSLLPLHNHMFATGHNSSINIYNWSGGKWQRRKIKGAFNSWITCMLALNSDRLASDDFGGNVHIGHFLLSVPTGHTEPIRSLWLLDEGMLACGTHDQRIVVLDLNTGNKLLDREGLSACVPIDNRRVVMSCKDFSIVVFSRSGSSLKCEHTMTDHLDKIRVLESLGDCRLASGSDDKTVRIWNVNTGECTTQLIAHMSEITCLNFLSGGGGLVSGSRDGALHVWSTQTGELQRSLSGHLDVIFALKSLANDGLVSASKDGTMKIWNLGLNARQFVLQGHTDSVNILLAIGENKLASGSYDKTISIWELTTGQCLRTLTEHKTPIICMQMLDDNKLVSGSHDGSIIIWRLDDEKSDRCFYLLLASTDGKSYPQLDSNEINANTGLRTLNNSIIGLFQALR